MELGPLTQPRSPGSGTGHCEEGAAGQDLGPALILLRTPPPICPKPELWPHPANYVLGPSQS